MALGNLEVLTPPALAASVAPTLPTPPALPAPRQLPPPRSSNAMIPAVPSSKPKSKSKPIAPRETAPEPEPAASPPLVATTSRAPSIAPRNRRTVVWLILLMLALGTGAMAAAYYWPADF